MSHHILKFWNFDKDQPSTTKKKMKIQLATITDQNRQPEPPERKPNEDSAAYLLLSSDKTVLLAAAVMDGIPVLRNRRGRYPPLRRTGYEAAKIASSLLIYPNLRFLTPKSMRNYFGFANYCIRAANKTASQYLKTPSHLIATVGCALWIEKVAGKAIFGYIGDPIAFYIPMGDEPRLLGRDQLAAWALHLDRPNHQKIGGDGYAGAQREWQDKHLRNKSEAKCWCGAKVKGWGALTGEPEAIEFVEIQTIRLAPHGRFILASDAICVFGGAEKHERSINQYLGVLDIVSKLPPKAAAEKLLALTRKEEKRTNAHSDDATFVVVDWEEKL